MGEIFLWIVLVLVTKVMFVSHDSLFDLQYQVPPFRAWNER